MRFGLAGSVGQLSTEVGNIRGTIFDNRRAPVPLRQKPGAAECRHSSQAKSGAMDTQTHNAGNSTVTLGTKSAPSSVGNEKFQPDQPPLSTR